MITALVETVRNKFKSPELKALEQRVDRMQSVVNENGLLDGMNFVYTGEKFLGGWGVSKDYEVVDLPLLRNHSLELWRSNPIANAIFDRMETKIIGDGLHLEATPEVNILGFESDSDFIQTWTENIESYYRIISLYPELVDEKSRLVMPQLQRQAFNTASLSGDTLIIIRIDPLTLLPRIQIVDGKHIHTPFEFSMGINPKTGRNIIHGVEVQDNGTEAGYWVRTRAFKPGINNLLNLGYVFVPAYGASSGRRVAHLLYGSRLRVDEYRGMPLLGAVMQMLKQIDRALDYEQLAMALDATLVMSVVKDVNTKPDVSALLGGGPMKKASVAEKTVDVTQPDGGTKPVEFKQMAPGLIMDNLPPGTKIESHSSRRPNLDLMKSVMGAFNIISASVGVPPEIAILTFNNNFSASRQAVNEFEATKRKAQSNFNAGFNDPYYRQLVIGLELTGKINMPGFMDSILFGDKTKAAAWLMADWVSRTELSVDMLKHIKMLQLAHELGYLTHEAAAKKFFGTSSKKVVAKLAKENLALADALRPIKELENPSGG